jgi:hypothetical protein
VDTLQSTENQFSTVDHLSNLTASLLVVKGIVPDLAGRIDKILTPMNWGDLYDPSKGWYKGGWRLDKKDFDIHQKGLGVVLQFPWRPIRGLAVCGALARARFRLKAGRC